MNRSFFLLASLGLALFPQSSRAAAQFVEITAELQIESWSYWFSDDEYGWSAQRGQSAGSVFVKPVPIRFVVGTNMWLMESDFLVRNARRTRWFSGGRILERTLITKPLPAEEVSSLSRKIGVAMGESQAGQAHFREYLTADGNPGQPAGSADLFMDAAGMVTWLAYCSGPALKREGRKIPPPSAFWKQHFSGDFEDRTICFDDTLGLPRTIEVFTKKGQTVFRYQARGATNVLGWNFPLEFYLAQYERSRTNSIELGLIAKGRIVAIAPGVEPRLTFGQPSAPEK